MTYSDLDLNLLKTFITVYESGSIISASNKLCISQPAVSLSIKRLEEYLGGSLFVRLPKGVKPTNEGMDFYNACKSLANELNLAINNYQSYLGLKKGLLNIGSSSTIIRALLLPFIDKFTKKYPNIQLIIHDGTSPQLTKLLQKGEIDLAIMNEPVTNEEIFDKQPFTKTVDCFIASPNFEKDFIQKNDIGNYSLIVQKTLSNNRVWFEKMCIKNKVNLQPKYETSSFGLISDFVSQGMGIGYTIKEFIQKDLDSKRVKILKTDFEIEPRFVSIFALKGQIDSVVLRVFREELLKFFNK